MSKNLLILRHGKSARPENIPDKDRPLKKRGKRNAELIGYALKEWNIKPDMIMTSDAKRAGETAKRMSGVLGMEDRIIEKSALYLAGTDVLLQEIRSVALTMNTLMLVGHNPGLEDLVSLLVSGGSLDYHLPTGGLVSLNYEGDWRNTGNKGVTLDWIFHPRMCDFLLIK